MTEQELRTWMRRESLSDAWFVSAREGEVSPDIMTLSEICERYAGSGEVPDGIVFVLHESQQARKQPAWVELDLHSFEQTPAAAQQGAGASTLPLPPQRGGQAAAGGSAQQQQQGQQGQARRSGRSSSQRRKRRTRGMFIQLIVLIVLLVIGWGIWYGATREKEELPTQALSPEQQQALMLARLQRNIERNSRGAEQDQAEPIRTVVSATQRMLMVKNSNLDAWPSFKLRIISPDGKEYQCEFNEEIPAYSTLSISMRKITNAKGEYLQREQLATGTRIELEIPGYQKWSSKL